VHTNNTYIYCRGLRCSAGEGRPQADIVPSPGRAVLHLGQHLHEVTAVTAGERYVARFIQCIFVTFCAGLRSSCGCARTHTAPRRAPAA
jgi:hypothetical protein